MKIILTLVASQFLTLAVAQAGQGPTVGLQPRTFTLNKGQWPTDVVAATRYGDVDMFITRDGMVVDRYQSDDVVALRTGTVVRMAFDNAQPGTLALATHIGKTTFIRGRDTTRWITAPTVESVTLRNVYDGIDVVYHYDGPNVRFDIHVAGFASESQVALRIEGAFPRVDNHGTVSFGTSGISMSGLKFLQQGDVLVSAMSVSHNAAVARIEFDIHGRNIAQPMTIDPVVYGTYLGSGLDTYAGIKRLVDGSIAVVGSTTELRFPASIGGYKDSLAGGREVFVAIFDSTLSRVTSYTYVGGTRDDIARGVATDARGAIYITGTTNSDDFPTSASAASPVYRGERDAFIVKLTQGASQLTIGTYVGGSADDVSNVIAVDADSNIYIAGETRSISGFPVTSGYQRTHGGRLDGFVTKVSSNGSRVLFSTYLGSPGDESFYGLDVDATGSVLVTGYTSADSWKPFPPVPYNPGDPNPPYQPRYNGGKTDATVARFDPEGGSLIFAGFLGGSGDDVGRAAFFDLQGRPNIVITTTSPNLEIVGGFAQAHFGGMDIAQYVFSGDGRMLLASTYFGGAGDDEVLSATPDAMGGVLLGGVTTSMDFPLRGAGSDASRNGPTDGFVASLSTGAIRASDIIVGHGDDAVIAVSSDPNGDAYFVAAVTSGIHKTHDGAYNSELKGVRGGYVGKLVRGALTLSTPIGGEQWCRGTTQTVSWSPNGMLPSDRYMVEISPDSGATWIAIASDVSGSNYGWQIRDEETGAYLLRVRSHRGHLEQTRIPIVILSQPAIAQQPTPVADCAGRPATLTVTSLGGVHSYQWRHNGVAVEGATSSTYTIPALTPQSVGRYECRISGRCNPAATTTTVEVTIVEAPVLTSQPISQNLDIGQRLELSVSALGSGLDYQWQRNGARVDKATNSQFVIEAVSLADAGSYSCTVTSECGLTISQTASIVVQDPTSASDGERSQDFFVRGPNPATGSLSMALSEDLGDVTIELFDVTGKSVALFVTSSPQPVFDITALPNGVYLLSARAGSRLFHQVVVVSK